MASPERCACVVWGPSTCQHYQYVSSFPHAATHPFPSSAQRISSGWVPAGATLTGAVNQVCLQPHGRTLNVGRIMKCMQLSVCKSSNWTEYGLSSVLKHFAKSQPFPHVRHVQMGRGGEKSSVVLLRDITFKHIAEPSAAAASPHSDRLQKHLVLPGLQQPLALRLARARRHAAAAAAACEASCAAGPCRRGAGRRAWAVHLGPQGEPLGVCMMAMASACWGCVQGWVQGVMLAKCTAMRSCT